MKKEILTGAVQTTPAVIGDVWLWITNHELAWFASALTILYILSQLFWGWSKYFRNRGEE